MSTYIQPFHLEDREMLNLLHDKETYPATVKAHKNIFLLLLVMILNTQGASAQTIVTTVGVFGCHFTSLQAAVHFMASQPAEATKIIRIDNRFVQTSQAVIIEDLSVTIDGGFRGCSGTLESPTPSELVGIGSAPVLHVFSSQDTVQEVVLKNLIVSGGGGDHGGGLLAEGAVVVRAQDTVFQDNSAEQGGAVALRDGAILDIRRVRMASNVAANTGGAIYCPNGGILGRGDNVFSFNTARFRGGALDILEDCTSTFFGAHAFLGNTSAVGGAMVNHADTAFLQGSGGGRPVFIENRADLGDVGEAHSGGAIFHVSNELILQNALFEDNSIGAEDGFFVGNGGHVGCGGAISFGLLTWSARIESTRSTCDGGPCSVFRRNQGDRGAAFCVGSGGPISMKGVLMEEQTGTSGGPASSVIFLKEGAMDTVLENVMIVGNSADRVLFRHGQRGDLTIAYSTIAGNHNASQMILDRDPSQNLSGYLGQIHLISSIFWENPETILLDAPGIEVSTECLLLSETQSVPLPAHWLDLDPRFEDPPTGDFSLAASSPAIDFCAAGTYPVPERDLGQGLRGHDDPSTPNAGPGRTYDIGADEFGTDASLFSDGFESGSASAWSLIVG